MRLFRLGLSIKKQRNKIRECRLITDDNVPVNGMELEIKGVLLVIQHFIDNRKSHEMNESCRAANALKYPGKFAIQYVGDLHKKLAYFEYHAEAARLDEKTDEWIFAK